MRQRKNWLPKKNDIETSQQEELKVKDERMIVEVLRGNKC